MGKKKFFSGVSGFLFTLICIVCNPNVQQAQGNSSSGGSIIQRSLTSVTPTSFAHNNRKIAQVQQCNSSTVRPYNQSASIVPPLSTVGAKIVDSECKQVVLKGVAWSGAETQYHVPQGLYLRDYKSIIQEMRSYGFNMIRIPYSVNALRSDVAPGAIDYKLGSNVDLQGKKPVEVLDILIQEAQKNGLMVLLDSHDLNDSQLDPLWYNSTFSEQDWINTWTMLAQRYKNQTNVIGADLKNEPHYDYSISSGATWGTGNVNTDWNLAAERCGNAIQAFAPNWLIVVEGIGDQPGNQTLQNHWWGGNLEKVGSFPVRLNISNKVVYSAHEYGPELSDQPWFHAPDFPNNLDQVWQTGWLYIANQNIAPVMIGEFGISNTDQDQTEKSWATTLLNVIQTNNLSYAYWAWSNNGGLLENDWNTPDPLQQQFLLQILPGTPSRNQTPS